MVGGRREGGLVIVSCKCNDKNNFMMSPLSSTQTGRDCGRTCPSGMNISVKIQAGVTRSHQESPGVTRSHQATPVTRSAVGCFIKQFILSGFHALSNVCTFLFTSLSIYI